MRGGCTITLTTPLPQINRTTDVNGYSQPGASVNTLAAGTNADLRIVLFANGQNSGLQVNAPNSRIRGLVFNGYAANAVNLVDADASGTVIDGNFVGTTRDGTALGAGSRFRGILVNGADNVRIGGTAAEERNLFGGNTQEAIRLASAADSTLIQGNLMGTDATGTTALANRIGITSLSSTNALIGGTAAGAGNVFSGNSEAGIIVAFPATTGTRVEGNLIGLDATGAVAIPNGVGVKVGSGTSGNVVGGTAPGARNVMSGNLSSGLQITGPGTTGNRVEGNYIGTDVTGLIAVPNATTLVPSLAGVLINAGASSNTVGGASAAARNVISGNLGDGLQILTGSAGNLVQGNYIGLDANGGALPNGRHGVVLFDPNGTPVPDNVIDGNVISNNPRKGVAVDGVGTGTQVTNNLLGADPSGTVAMGNGFGPGGPAPAIDVLNGAECLVAGNRILFNRVGLQVRDIGGGLGPGTLAVGSTNNCLVFNQAGAQSSTGVPITFTGNWWGFERRTFRRRPRQRGLGERRLRLLPVPQLGAGRVSQLRRGRRHQAA